MFFFISLFLLLLLFRDITYRYIIYNAAAEKPATILLHKAVGNREKVARKSLGKKVTPSL